MFKGRSDTALSWFKMGSYTENTMRTRTLAHPGRYNPVRIDQMTSRAARHIRLLLLAGVSLYDGLVLPLAKLGIQNASTTILGGTFSALEYCVAPPDPMGGAVIAYSAPLNAGPCQFVFGNATLGTSAKGQPMVHCHAVIRTKDGRIKGGHILTETAIVTGRAITVLVTSIDEFSIRQAFDPETRIPLFQPMKDSRDA